jgi:DNA-binding NtrC family response regulator
MVAEGAFREDLYFRINACSLEIPPLRSRTEDIPPLIDFFISQMGVDTVISPTAMHLLMIHNWPGTVRELKNVIETACVLAESSIEPEHLPSEFAGDVCPMEVFQTVSSRDDKGIDQAMAEMEKSLILSALRQAGAVQKHAARILGIKERSLWHRISKYNIDVAAIRESLG